MDINKLHLQPVEKKSLYIKISDTIYNYIRINELKPGDKLPSEREMALMLETSRNSVREALRVLEHRGIISVKTGKGIFISDNYGQHNLITLELNSCSMKDMYELQETLDIRCVCNAIDNASKQQKEKLMNIATEMNKLAKEDIYSYSLDHQFHNMLCELGSNLAIQQLLLSIRKDRYINQFKDEKYEKVWLKAVGYHFELAKAIFDENSEAAIQIMKEMDKYSYDPIIYESNSEHQ